jgi:hypothetical protein
VERGPGRRPRSHPLQTPAYLAAVLKAGGGRDSSRLYTLTDGRRLVLPLIEKSLLPGLGQAGDYPAGFGHGSVLATGGLRTSDVATVVADLHQLGLSIRIGGGHHTAEQWSAGLRPGVVEIPRRVDVVELSMGYDEYLARTARRGARQSVAPRPLGTASRSRSTPPAGWSPSSTTCTCPGSSAGSPARGCRPRSPGTRH